MGQPNNSGVDIMKIKLNKNVATGLQVGAFTGRKCMSEGQRIHREVKQIYRVLTKRRKSDFQKYGVEYISLTSEIISLFNCLFTQNGVTTYYENTLEIL